jgi:hypothetical protein
MIEPSEMGNPQPRALETGSRFNDYSKYPNVFYTMEKGARMGSGNSYAILKDIVWTYGKP